jgi:GTPase SAR1 family protein
MKLMFVGNGNVGKTSLVKAFRTPKKERERLMKLDPASVSAFPAAEQSVRSGP